MNNEDHAPRRLRAPPTTSTLIIRRDCVTRERSPTTQRPREAIAHVINDTFTASDHDESRIKVQMSNFIRTADDATASQQRTLLRQLNTRVVTRTTILNVCDTIDSRHGDVENRDVINTLKINNRTASKAVVDRGGETPLANSNVHPPTCPRVSLATSRDHGVADDDAMLTTPRKPNESPASSDQRTSSSANAPRRSIRLLKTTDTRGPPSLLSMMPTTARPRPPTSDSCKDGQRGTATPRRPISTKLSTARPRPPTSHSFRRRHRGTAPARRQMRC